MTPRTPEARVIARADAEFYARRPTTPLHRASTADLLRRAQSTIQRNRRDGLL